MRFDAFRRFVVPPGPILVLTLVGLMLLSAVLYNRAVRAQRFLEPTLAIFQPRFEFYASIERLIHAEFGAAEVLGLRFEGSSILLDERLLYADAHHMENAPAIRRLGRVFKELLSDPEMRAYVDFVMVSPRAPLAGDPERDRQARIEAQTRAEAVLSAILLAEPTLGRDYAIYFESSATPVYPERDELRWIEFRIVPSDRIHVDVLQRLEKYIPSHSPPHDLD
jgi:hypothetical protein